MTRLAIISDLHGNLPALEAVLADIQAQGIREIYHLGDLVGYNPFPNETVALVRERGLPGLTGNYDRAVSDSGPEAIATYLNPKISPMALEIYHWTLAEVTADTRAYLASLPEQLSLQINQWQILLTHGSPRQIREYVRPHLADETLKDILAGVEAQIVLTGHTHIPLVRNLNGQWLINPGSVGFPKDGDPRASYAILELGETLGIAIRRIEYDIERTAQAIVARGLPLTAAETLRRGRR
ncbi:MAG: metallophosphoesterase family protein [Desulfobacca sp.]|nr:metallophosphoesterase family protein [Desulfobacca sp.]